MRIPLIIAGPGVRQGKRVDELVYQHSMFATTCELAGLQPGEQVEFPSLAPSAPRPWPPPCMTPSSATTNPSPAPCAPKPTRWCIYPALKKTQIFDMVADPYETRDISATPEGARLHPDLLAKLKALQTQLGDKLQVA